MGTCGWRMSCRCRFTTSGLLEDYWELVKLGVDRDQKVEEVVTRVDGEEGYPVCKQKERFPLLAAYDLCLKCSHLFNILDSRGAISVTERVGVIARVRALAVGIAKACVDQQQGGKSVEQDDMIKAVQKPARATKSKKLTVTS